MIDILKNRIKKGVVTIGAADILNSRVEFVETIGKELKAVILKKFGRSFHIREVDTGSCGGCESEIITATNPLYDIQRFGIDFAASPRHADALLVTGPVSKNMKLALKKTCDAMPGPKIVISLGNCALDGWVFKNSYYIEGGVKNVLPVSLHIPGCPPEPIEIIKDLLSFLKNYQKI